MPATDMFQAVVSYQMLARANALARQRWDAAKELTERLRQEHAHTAQALSKAHADLLYALDVQANAQAAELLAKDPPLVLGAKADQPP